MKDRPFYKEAELLIRVLPLVNKEKCFALKGGTAINFFWRDLPRLSVDIDLTFLPILSREISLGNISSALERIAEGVEGMGKDFGAKKTIAKGGQRITKLMVSDWKSRIYGRAE